MKVFVVGDKVEVSANAEECCASQDAGRLGIVTKVRNPEDITVKSEAGEWRHCSNCIEHYKQSSLF